MIRTKPGEISEGPAIPLPTIEVDMRYVSSAVGIYSPTRYTSNRSGYVLNVGNGILLWLSKSFTKLEPLAHESWDEQTFIKLEDSQLNIGLEGIPANFKL